MPIVTIETLSDNPLSEDDAMPTSQQLQRLADALGDLFGSQPSGTWVKVRQQSRAYYAENQVMVDSDIRPVIVEILKADMEGEHDLAIEAAGVCALVAKVLGRPTKNVHVIYQPAARGRVAFGGKLVH